MTKTQLKDEIEGLKAENIRLTNIMSELSSNSFDRLKKIIKLLALELKESYNK